MEMEIKRAVYREAIQAEAGNGHGEVDRAEGGEVGLEEEEVMVVVILISILL